jgi:hypothetical protein
MPRRTFTAAQDGGQVVYSINLSNVKFWVTLILALCTLSATTWGAISVVGEMHIRSTIDRELKPGGAICDRIDQRSQEAAAQNALRLQRIELWLAQVYEAQFGHAPPQLPPGGAYPRSGNQTR